MIELGQGWALAMVASVAANAGLTRPEPNLVELMRERGVGLVGALPGGDSHDAIVRQLLALDIGHVQIDHAYVAGVAELGLTEAAAYLRGLLEWARLEQVEVWLAVGPRGVSLRVTPWC